MWFLKGPKGEIIYLKRNSPITVGRIQGDIVLRDDKSISRNHASVSVEPRSGKNESLCFVKDLGSKYGSTILRGNETIKIEKERTRVRHNDKIKFGLQNNDYIAFYIPTVVLVSSMSDIKYLQSIINDLDGYIVQEWTSEVTHLTTVKAKLGEKIAMALVNCIPIVGIEFWEAVQKAVKNNQDWPKFSQYILPISEDIIDNSKVSLSPNINRKTLFKGLTFLFFSYSQLNIYKKIVNDAGGKTLMFNKSIHSDLNQFCSDKFVVVYYMIGSSQTEESILETQKTKSAYEKIDELLRKSKRRIVSDSEILMAILYCSLEKNCNTKHSYKKELLREQKSNASTEKKTILAPDSDELRSNSLVSPNKNNIVPETNEFTSQDFRDTAWSCIANTSKAPTPSLGISTINRGDSQESTEDIGSEFTRPSVDPKRTEKRSAELASSTPVKRVKFNSGSSLFPVISKKSSQNILNSQDLLVSQNSRSSQLSNRDDSIIVDRVIKSTSHSESKFSQPSTSNDGNQKAKGGNSIFGSWMEEKPKASKIQIIEEVDKPKRRTGDDKRDNTLKENQIPQISRSDDSSSNASSLGGKNKRNAVDVISDSVKVVSIDDEEPQTKKRKINANGSSSSSGFKVASEKNNKRKRDSANDSDSNRFAVQKKKQNRDDNEKIIKIVSSEAFNSDDDYVIVEGLIRHDTSSNDSVGQKMFSKACNTIPRMRISLDSMVPYGIEVE